MLVRDVMTTPAIATTPDEPIEALLKRWREHPVSGFPVVEGGHVVGVVSEGDLIWRERTVKTPPVLALFDMLIPLERPGRFQEELHKTYGAVVREVMSHPAVTIGPDETVAAAASLMTDRHLNRLPVVDAQGALVGIVSRSDLVRALI